MGILPPSDSAGPDGPSVTGGPVGQPGTLPPSTFASAILVDPGGTFPSSDLAGMLLPAILVRPVASGGTEEDRCGSRREEACCARWLVWSGHCWGLCRGCGATWQVCIAPAPHASGPGFDPRCWRQKQGINFSALQH